jgi:hypothetical protein
MSKEAISFDVEVKLFGQVVARSREEADGIVENAVDELCKNKLTGFIFPDVDWSVVKE